MGPRRQREEVEEAGSEQEAGAGSRAGDGCGVSVSVAKLEMPACRGQSWGAGVFSRWCRGIAHAGVDTILNSTSECIIDLNRKL